jgi:hypothetical protein
MIVEMRTYQLKPKTVPRFEDLFAKALPDRAKLSRLGGCWHTEVGELDQVVVFWPYDSHAHREQVLAEARNVKTWPPPVQDLIENVQTKILNPAPFNPPLGERQLGNIYEIRQYMFRAGSIPKVIERWTPMMAAREKLSPLVGCWSTEIGPLNQWVHIWAYKDAADRQRVRGEAVKAGIWPPDTAEWMLKMTNMLTIPAAFSPLR